MDESANFPAPRHLCAPDRAPRLTLVLPVHNEERVLRHSVLRVSRHMAQRLRGLPYRLVIADNGSTDRTPLIASALARELRHVEHMALSESGRGRALRAAWTAHPAEVVAYMDVDLSSDLDQLGALLEPLLDGHADVCIGTRLDPGSQVTRGWRREILSRGYNRLLALTLGAGFSDAQCGFKALRGPVATALLEEVADQEWFFDTELLIRAQRRGLVIREVPVRWVEDPDSRVRIGRTVAADLRGVARLRREGRARSVAFSPVWPAGSPPGAGAAAAQAAVPAAEPREAIGPERAQPAVEATLANT